MLASRGADFGLSRVLWTQGCSEVDNSHSFPSLCGNYQITFAVSVPQQKFTRGFLLYLSSTCGELLSSDEKRWSGGGSKKRYIKEHTVMTINWRKNAKGNGKWRQCAPPEVHDLIALMLRKMSHMPCTLMGFSRGASEVLRFVSVYPGALKASRVEVVLVAPYFPPSLSDESEKLKACAALRAGLRQRGGETTVVIGGADDFKKDALLCLQLLQEKGVRPCIIVPPGVGHDDTMKVVWDLAGRGEILADM